MTALKENSLNSEEFQYIAGFLQQRSGLTLGVEKSYLVETRLQPVAEAHGLPDSRALIGRLRSQPTPQLASQVVEAMTTNESMFFRDGKPFEQLRQVVWPALKAAGRMRVRIWSAACSTGQEPYSIAMSWLEEEAALGGMQCEIFATDIADKVLLRAQEGVYSRFETQRGLPDAMRSKYFQPQPGERWSIEGRVKQLVRFAPANLLESYAALGKFDIIFCRNVLIYFDDRTKTEVLERMASSLNAPGYLFLGSAENTLNLTAKFTPSTQHRGMFTLA